MLQNRKEGRSRQYQIVQPVQLFAEISAMAPALTCKTRHAPSREEHPERWPSGLRRTLGKRVCGKPYRGFESHSLRQLVVLPHSPPFGNSLSLLNNLVLSVRFCLWRFA